MLLDLKIMIFVVLFLEAPAIVYRIFLMAHLPPGPAGPGLFFGDSLYDVFAFSFVFNKDIYLGQSIGKRILRLQVVDVRTNRPANPLRCLIRNFTILLWPIEVIAALIDKERRIGDYLAGTRLAIYDPAVKAEPNWGLMIVAVAIGMVFTYAVTVWPFKLLFHTLPPHYQL